MFPSIQASFVSGELSPSLFGRVDLAKYKNGCSTLRNFFVNYQGGASTRAGLAYCGMCKQGAPNTGGTLTNNSPRDIRFQFNINQGYDLEFGDQYMRIKSNGAYVVEATKNITAATNAAPLVITSVAHGFSNNDWVYITGMGGMTELNGLIWIVINKTADTFQLTDLFGSIVNSNNFSVYTSGGTAARIYTVVSPYAAIDLPYLKFTQSADTMSLTCVNTVTLTEYTPYELQRVAATNWTFTATSYGSNIAAPTGVSVVAHASTALSTYYSYVVTAVDALTGQESVASSVGTVQNNDIAINAGSNTITWTTVSGAGSYNIYSATPSYGVVVPVGAAFGFMGSSFGTQFTDTNIIPDFTVVPPVHANPFARGQVTQVTPTNTGGSYTQSTIGYSITTSTGSGAVIVPVVVNGNAVAYIVQNAGQLYAPADTITITDSGSGHDATATLTIGAASGTYPSVVAYYQQRRGYADTLNKPDTYFFSQPGAYKNMDSSIPVTPSDAIVGTPWAQQINGIQWMIPMPNGLIVLTGNGGWLVNGGNSAALTPIDQTAIQQANVGCSALVPPILINSDILYVQSKNSIVRDLTYNFFTNIYVGEDKSILANHLFFNHTITQWAYAEEPYKIIWCVRDDGILLSFTWLKEQDIWAWARHDTDGIVVSVCTVTEPPVDAIYVIVKRYIRGQWVYYSERMNNRLWDTVEDCFCVDAGLAYPMTSPAATLTPAAANGTANISATNLIYGGTGYTAPTAIAVDSLGGGTGATFSVTVVAGIITAITPILQGEDYTPGATNIVISDSTGTGAIANPIITNNVVFTSSNAVFTANNVGDVIRVGGGKATVTAYTSTTQVIADITQSITDVLTDDPDSMPIPATSGNWTITTPTSTVTGLNHLEGKTVAILADGSVVTNQTVVDGSITLPSAASAIVVGLPFLPQLQTMYLDAQQQTTVQGKRKNIQSVTVRVENTRGISVGTNQPDASTEPDGENVPWSKMYEMKQRNSTQWCGTPIDLYTGDLFELVSGEWAKPGQIAIQQNFPLPANILAVIPNWQIGDTNG